MCVAGFRRGVNGEEMRKTTKKRAPVYGDKANTLVAGSPFQTGPAPPFLAPNMCTVAHVTAQVGVVVPRNRSRMAAEEAASPFQTGPSRPLHACHTTLHQYAFPWHAHRISASRVRAGSGEAGSPFQTGPDTTSKLHRTGHGRAHGRTPSPARPTLSRSPQRAPARSPPRSRAARTRGGTSR